MRKRKEIAQSSQQKNFVRQSKHLNSRRIHAEKRNIQEGEKKKGFANLDVWVQNWGLDREKTTLGKRRPRADGEKQRHAPIVSASRSQRAVWKRVQGTELTGPDRRRNIRDGRKKEIKPSNRQRARRPPKRAANGKNERKKNNTRQGEAARRGRDPEKSTTLRLQGAKFENGVILQTRERSRVKKEGKRRKLYDIRQGLRNPAPITGRRKPFHQRTSRENSRGRERKARIQRKTAFLDTRRALVNNRKPKTNKRKQSLFLEEGGRGEGASPYEDEQGNE